MPFDKEQPAKQPVEFTRDELQLLNHLVEGEIASLENQIKLASQNEGIKYKIDTLSGLISFYDKLKSMSLLPKLKWVNMNDSK